MNKLARAETMARKFHWVRLSNQALEAFKNDDFVACAKLLQGAFRQIEAFGSTDSRLAYASNLIGISLAKLGKFEEAVPYFKRAAKIYQANKDIAHINNLSWLGWCFYQLHHWRRSAKAFAQAITSHLRQKVDDENALLHMLTHCAAAFWFSGDSSTALQLFTKAVQTADSKTTSLTECGWLCLTLNDLEITGRLKRHLGPKFKGLIAQSYMAFQRKVNESKPPGTQTVTQSDKYFGLLVEDPYRWLESIWSPDVQKWANEQNRYSQQFLHHIPGRSTLIRKVWDFINEEELRLPRKVGSYYYFSRRARGTGHLQLLRAKRLGQFPAVVLDGNSLPKNSQLVEFWISDDGRYAAYAESEKGSEWQTIHIQDLKTGAKRREKLRNLTYVHIDWKADNSGFYYSAISSPHRKQTLQRIFFHKLGTSQKEDKLLYEGINLDELFGMNIVDGKHLLVSTVRADENLFSVRLKSLKNKRTGTTTLLPEQEYPFSYAGSHKDILYFVTNMKAPKARLVALRLNESSKRKSNIEQILPEKSFVLERAMIFPDFILAFYLTHRGTLIQRLNFEGKLLGETKLPDLTTISADGYGYGSGSELFFEIDSYTSPKRIVKYNPQNDQIRPVGPVRNLFDSNQYLTELRYATSNDGTRVPLYISYKRGLKRNGNNPVILTGYGGFGVSTGPSFDPYNMAWMDLGGIFAEAVLRGGGESGWQWRISGMRRKKQNTFDDFISAARYLIDERYTCATKLGICGGSNGGLLVGAALTQHPNLFGAAVVMTGVLDMLRYHEFNLARHYIGEFGVSSDKQDFRVLYGYSPLHRLRRGKYPPTLVLTFANDDRVSPAHSYKFAAMLQKSQTAQTPIMLSVESNAGHSGRHDSDWAINVLSFFAYHLGVVSQRLLAIGARKDGL